MVIKKIFKASAFSLTNCGAPIYECIWSIFDNIYISFYFLNACHAEDESTLCLFQKKKSMKTSPVQSLP